ncbi:putative bifunctional diguanylate cyclase/phosphodiesterase [Photobacterium leiognathi]|uniref:putative bifunctional diguanylate cyclase/phosphodiesterase n=1 Tax=Photobacterium leiognathi TaxID=553611 RepID=UPI002735E9D2|nr:EAL domain-containing protein [Photobacterium leiognathi]
MDIYSPLNHLQSPIWIFDFDHKQIIWANDKALPLWESPSHEELLSRDLSKDMSAAVEATLEEYRETFKQNKTIKTWWHLDPRKVGKNLLCNFSGITLPDGRIAMLVEVIGDESSLRCELAFSDCANLALLFDEHGDLVSANNVFTKNYGNDLHNLASFVGDSDIAKQWIDNAIINQDLKHSRLCWTGQSHIWFNIEAKWLADKSQLLLQIVNITKEKENLQRERYNAEHDFLTGLMNRRGISSALKASHHFSLPYNLLFLDLDSFKLVNDTYGHAVGDKLLRAVAIRLLDTVKCRGLVARFGGDEFIIQIEERNTPNLELLTREIITALNRPFYIKNIGEISIGCSIGTAQYPKDADTFETLITQADMAMHCAKKHGRNCSYHFQPHLAETLYRKNALRHHLSQALEIKDFQLYYQPIIDLSTMMLKGFEALIRWYDDSLGHVSPAEFIPLAEETGQIVPIGSWVLRKACEQLAEWNQKYDTKLIMSINLSRAQLKLSLVEELVLIIEEYNIDPSQIALEITESAMLQEFSEAKPCLDAIAALGFELYLDDFGTGYSSLSQLQNLPISTVKLDQSFVQNEQDSGKAIVEATKAICNKLNLKVVAEGIETKQQLDYIQSCNFNYCQGYYFNKPLSVQDLENGILSSLLKHSDSIESETN